MIHVEHALKVAADLAMADAEIVEHIAGFAFTRGELRTAFERVQHPQNWKFAIDAVVVLANDRERMAMHVAVPFYTGSRATLEYLSGMTWRVRAAGYYATVGA